MGGQGEKHLEFRGREIQEDPVLLHFVTVTIHGERAIVEAHGRWPSPASLRLRTAFTRYKFPRAERFDYIVVRSQGKPATLSSSDDLAVSMMNRDVGDRFQFLIRFLTAQVSGSIRSRITRREFPLR